MVQCISGSKSGCNVGIILQIFVSISELRLGKGLRADMSMKRRMSEKTRASTSSADWLERSSDWLGVPRSKPLRCDLPLTERISHMSYICRDHRLTVVDNSIIMSAMTAVSHVATVLRIEVLHVRKLFCLEGAKNALERSFITPAGRWTVWNPTVLANRYCSRGSKLCLLFLAKYQEMIVKVS